MASPYMPSYSKAMLQAIDQAFERYISKTSFFLMSFGFNNLRRGLIKVYGLSRYEDKISRYRHRIRQALKQKNYRSYYKNAIMGAKYLHIIGATSREEYVKERRRLETAFIHSKKKKQLILPDQIDDASYDAIRNKQLLKKDMRNLAIAIVAILTAAGVWAAGRKFELKTTKYGIDSNKNDGMRGGSWALKIKHKRTGKTKQMGASAAMLNYSPDSTRHNYKPDMSKSKLLMADKEWLDTGKTLNEAAAEIIDGTADDIAIDAAYDEDTSKDYWREKKRQFLRFLLWQAAITIGGWGLAYGNKKFMEYQARPKKTKFKRKYLIPRRERKFITKFERLIAEIRKAKKENDYLTYYDLQIQMVNLQYKNKLLKRGSDRKILVDYYRKSKKLAKEKARIIEPEELDSPVVEIL